MNSKVRLEWTNVYEFQFRTNELQKMQSSEMCKFELAF